MRRIFRLTILLGLVGGAVAAVRRLVGPKPQPVQEVHGAPGAAAEDLPAGHTYTSGSSDQPAPTETEAPSASSESTGNEPESQ